MTAVQRIAIRIKKGNDGSATLACTRADGSTTWQRQEGGQARFFPRHDLTHFVVETVLGQRNGFYGLVASGWDLSDFGTPWPRGRLPKEANLVEMIVGFLDRERASGERLPAADLNADLAAFARDNGLPEPVQITDADLARIRQRRAELFAAWDAVASGEALELAF